MRADWIKLMIAAARLPLHNEPANNQFERSSAHSLIWFSQGLLNFSRSVFRLRITDWLRVFDVQPFHVEEVLFIKLEHLPSRTATSP